MIQVIQVFFVAYLVALESLESISQGKNGLEMQVTGFKIPRHVRQMLSLWGRFVIIAQKTLHYNTIVLYIESNILDKTALDNL